MRSNLTVFALIAALAAAGCAASGDSNRVCKPMLSWASPAFNCETMVLAEPPPPEVEPEPEPEPERVMVKGEKIEITEVVQFEYDSAVLLEESKDLLREVAKAMQDQPDIKLVQVDGHTDDRGGERYNLDLSKQRAESVKKYLISQGVAESRLATKGFGKGSPITRNDTDEGRFRNRRVEFNILERDE